MSPWVLPLACWLGAALSACAADPGSQRLPERPRVGNFGRPPGMPIGTRGAAATEPDAELPPDVTDNADLPIPAYAAALPMPPPSPAPCGGCVELNVYVNDINQRDEFALALPGTRIERVVWTLRVSFNSDQLAVQPFVDAKRGKYQNLHVNAFPLGQPVELEQVFAGKAHAVGLVVGSSGAWTGNQTMSVFVDSVRIDGPRGASELRSFDASPEGFEARTHEHQGKLVWHAPEAPVAPGAPPAPVAPPLASVRPASPQPD